MSDWVMSFGCSDPRCPDGARLRTGSGRTRRAIPDSSFHSTVDTSATRSKTT
jgi:hypothetical protein